MEQGIDYIQKDEFNNHEKSTLLIDIVSFACIGGLLENIDLSSCDLFIIDTTIFTRRNENSIEKKFCKKIKKLGGKK